MPRNRSNRRRFNVLPGMGETVKKIPLAFPAILNILEKELSLP
jgi:hypothetical protein